MSAKPKSQFAEIEEKVLSFWQEQDIFTKSLKQRENTEVFSFYDGPPFANGLPHFGHSLVTSIKDALGRYKTMRGYYVERRNGWDCHGLPVEFAIEKQFGVSGKKQILELGLEKFNAACRDSVFAYKKDWEDFFDRIGRWTDTRNAYATIDREYTESVWWTLSQVHKKNLLYKGYKSMPYCPRCETPLSNFEVNEGYRDNVEDPSLFVKFKLLDEDAYLLGWTTTPWSLPGNGAIALNPNENYVYVELTDETGDKEVLVLAKKRLEILGDQSYSVVKEVKGSDLTGRRYQALFKIDGLEKQTGAENLYMVWPADFVSVDDGSGVLHVAPAFGEDDLNLGQAHGLPVLSTVDTGGHMQAGVGLKEVAGVFFKQADPVIIEYLTRQGNVFSAETTRHTYPFCYRCDSPLLYYAISTWFIKVSAIKEELQKTAESIDWMPAHIKSGRFGKWLEGARDWAVSRNRYWGAPMPIWVNEQDETDYIVVESITQLQELAGPDADLADLHRPYIDKVVIEKDGKRYQRVEEVLDCWFESGSMPVAQQHYPFENSNKFESSFPADYIGEGLDQTRLWFYVLHVISTILFEKPAYKNVLVNGMVLAADGQKLSKRLKNYPPVEDVFDAEGADTLRLYLLSNNQAVSADYMRFNRDAMKDLNRNVLGTLQNCFRFFKMYADIDGWEPPKQLKEPSVQNVLDEWLLARLSQTVKEATNQADNFKLAHSIQTVFGLIDDMSNWYVRRSRRRFWKSEDDLDKKQAYATLHYCLVRTCQLLAPWAPFLSDYLYRELTAGTNMPESVHLSDWPTEDKIDSKLIESMTQAREYINQGLAQRASAGIKVRQPLSSVAIPDLPSKLSVIVAEELNVKEVHAGKVSKVQLDLNINEDLQLEGLMRDLVRLIQNARKQAGLNVEDRIHLSLNSDSQEVTKAVTRYVDVIQAETLAKDLNHDKAKAAYSESVKVDGQTVTIGLTKA